MVFVKGCFLMLLHSLLCVSFPDTGYRSISNLNHECCCSVNNLGPQISSPVDTTFSWTPKPSKLISFSESAFTWVMLLITLLNIIVYKLRELHKISLGEDKIKKKPLLSSLSPEHHCRQFLLAEMQLATNNFDQSLIIGKGGFGNVYRGVIDHEGCNKMKVAIKRLDSKSNQGASEFWTEIKMLCKFRHSHLVSLIGYCDEFDEMMVVYEYVSGGNLGERLHKVDQSTNKPPLSWMERLKICIGAARGLDYLHTGTGVQHRIIHRDVKSSNILLDENMAAKVSDLGVSKVGPADQVCTHVSTQVKGSFGYFDPNYFMTHRLTRKSDVYSFGVVLLEVLCGRPAVDPSLGDNDLGLVSWAQRCIREGMLNHVIDPVLMGLTPKCLRVKSQIMPDCLNAFVEIADKCLLTRPKERPTMAEVVVALEAALALQQIEICSPFGNQRRANSYFKSGKITFSRMLQHMLPLKTPVRPGLGDVEPPRKKKRQHKSFLPSTLSNKQVLRSKSRDTFQEFNFKWEVADSALKIFTVAGLKVATRNFNHALVVGEGAFGKVFKGWVEQESYVPSTVASGMPIAVKKLNTDGYQGVEEWQAEVNFLGRLSHPNLVRLLGYCSEDKELLLVYEFMDKGSLENYIFKRGLGPPLPWSLQLKILIGVAQGIAFLHREENQIIFRDLKSSNILLDQDFNAKLADFGLAKHGPVNGDTHLSTMVMGTYGYAAPEYVATGHLNGKNDIYAFGVVLLEILTGLRVIDKTRPQKEQNLVEWARPMLLSKRKLKTIIDPNLGHDYTPEATFHCAALILKCTQPDPNRRPSIEQVLQSLEQFSEITFLPFSFLNHIKSFSFLKPSLFPPQTHQWSSEVIHHLHSSNPPVIHRDIQSSNVLFDGKWTARLGDFGFALRGHVEDDTRIQRTPPAGTLGYLDLCYLAPGVLSSKSDVLSFGILLLEIFSGRNAIDLNYIPPSIVDWAAPLIKSGEYVEIFDPEIEISPEDSSAVRMLVVLAARCVRSTAEKRSEMAEVVECLIAAGKRIRSLVWGWANH
ncbi:hypothetical protein OSB04_016826 [Centaurea solstitialis]|uniref:non-specific serine/threonine protein kinase n=1 Tax=Centaurea solstitialis TaxID=347529 RepID=A0AA38TEY0_9ASTR|nr:hypothetical protein OSB04_016826 [Centaurea solstitialis]